LYRLIGKAANTNGVVGDEWMILFGLIFCLDNTIHFPVASSSNLNRLSYPKLFFLILMGSNAENPEQSRHAAAEKRIE